MLALFLAASLSAAFQARVPADGGELAVSSRSRLSPAVVPPPISRKLEVQINTVIAANSRYQVGVALIDVTHGVVHEYGVRAQFVAASTAKILAASAYYRLVESGRASLGARMGVSTAGAQIRQMLQQSNNESWALINESLIPDAIPAGISVFHKYCLLFGNLHDASILVRGERAYVFVVYTLGRDTYAGEGR